MDAGEYTATVKPADGFTWEGCGNDAKRISWSIAKANNPNPPPSLDTAAPTTYGGSDGKITGTTAEMEYAADENFTSPTACTATETTGLTTGGCYVRYKADNNHNPGPAVPVTVPQGPVTVQSIAIDSSSTYKTQYTVGGTLDVTGLTLTVTMSNGSVRSVPVAAGMVTGFDSAATVESQTLTVTYGGQTTTYTISISENTGTDPTDPDSITVTAVSVGTAVIAVTTEDKGKTASCTVTVSTDGGGTGGGYSTQGGADLSAFSDGASVSADADEAMRWAVGNGLIVGTDRGILAPGGSATRAQAASILNRFVLNLMK